MAKKSKRSAPLQVSKTMSITLFDEEVEAWQTLQDFAVKKKLNVMLNPESKSVSNTRLLREILRMAAEFMALETGNQELPKKLSQPRAVWQRPRKQTSFTSETPQRPEIKRQPPKPTHRVVWNRQWKGPTGGT